MKTKYGVAYIKFCSADESELVPFLVEGKDEKQMMDRISDYFECDFEKDEYFETSCGNIYKFIGLQEIPDKEAEILKKYLSAIG